MHSVDRSHRRPRPPAAIYGAKTSRSARGAGCRRWLALALLLVLAGCSRGSHDLPEIGADLSASPEPPRVGPATVAVTLTGADGQPLSGATVELEGDMSHAGMVPVLAQATEVEPGRYQAQLEFTMAGDWFIVVRARLADGRSLERALDLPGVQ